MLADDELGLELVAGRGGVDGRGSITWAHITDLPDPTPWLSGGELVLTTGLSLQDSHEAQRRFVVGLDRRGCAAVGFGVGVWLDDVPPAMLVEAELRSLPVFTVPYEVPFIAVTKYVSRRVFESHYAGLRRALDLHRRMLSAVTSGDGLDAVLAALVRSIAAVDVVVFDPFGRVLARADGTEDPLDDAALWRLVAPRQHEAGTLTTVGRTVSIWPLQIVGAVDGVLALVSVEQIDEAEHLMVEQGMAAAAIELSRSRTARRARRAEVAEVLHETLEGRTSSARLSGRLEQFGLDATGSYQVVAVAPGQTSGRSGASSGSQPGPPLRVVTADAGSETACGLLEDATAPDARAAVGAIDEVAYAIVQPHDAPIGATVVALAHERGVSPPRIGRSAVQTDVDGLSSAVRQALAAARRSDGRVVDLADVGVEGVLASLHTDTAAAAFSERMLGALRAHDDESGALIDTVRAYLAHGCRPGPAADALRVHRHTLAYRLDRVAQLTGRDPRDGDHLLAYGLALGLLDDD